MTFLNPSVLLNMGAADAAKKTVSNTQSQPSQANTPDEFAQALRRQMQQAGKPAASQDDAKNRLLTKEARDVSPSRSSEQPAGQAAAIAADSADEKHTHESRGEQAEEAKPTEQTSAADETPQARRKRLLADLETTDAAAAGMAPWMQTMMAMRPATGQALGKGKDGSADIDAAEEPLQEDILPGKTTAVRSDAAGKASGAQLPLAAAVADDTATDQRVDVRQAAGDESNPALADKNSGFTETLGIAKAVAAAVQQMAGTDKTAAQLMNPADAGAEVSGAAQPGALPAAQALPNSPWLGAAGVSPTASVLMSQIATPFGNERWQTAMNQHVLNMVGSGDDVASLTLSPPDLGPIQVVLKVDNQSVNTSFISDNPLVRQALEDGMQDLRERMQSQGLALGQTFVGNGEQAQQHFGQQSPDDSGRTFGQSAQAGAGAEATTPAAAVRSTPVRGLVDTFV